MCKQLAVISCKKSQIVVTKCGRSVPYKSYLKGNGFVTLVGDFGSETLYLEDIMDYYDLAELCAYMDACLCGEFEGEEEDELLFVGVDNEWMCRLSDEKKVLIQFCKQEDGEVQIKDLDSGEILTDLSGYDACDLPTKSTVDSFFTELTDATVQTYTPSSPLNAISVGVSDPDRCNYVRVTYICPEGVAGCSLITPTQPIRTLSLPTSAEITSITFEVVAKDPNQTNIKNWSTTAPTSPIEVNVDGLDT